RRRSDTRTSRERVSSTPIERVIRGPDQMPKSSPKAKTATATAKAPSARGRSKTAVSDSQNSKPRQDGRRTKAAAKDTVRVPDVEAMVKRSPTEQEVADRLGVSVPELHEVISQISFVSVLALDELLSVGNDRGEQISLIDTLADKSIDPTHGLESQETRGLLA